MSRAAVGEAIAAVQGYVHYLQRLGVTELPVTFPSPGRTVVAVMPAPSSAAALPA